MKRIFAFVLALSFILSITAFSQETLTLTTYYPAPFGIYQRLVTNALGVGDTNTSGGIDSGDAPDPAADPNQTGDVWIAGEMGIGTTQPSSGGEQDLKLDVEGAVGAQYYCDEDGNNCSQPPFAGINDILSQRGEFCYYSNNDNFYTGTVQCPAGYNLLSCAGGGGDIEADGSWYITPDFVNQSCVLWIRRPQCNYDIGLGNSGSSEDEAYDGSTVDAICYR